MLISVVLLPIGNAPYNDGRFAFGDFQSESATDSMRKSMIKAKVVQLHHSFKY